MQMMIEYYLGQLLQNPTIDPLSVKANVMLATRYAEAMEQEHKKQDEQRQKQYEERLRAEDKKRNLRKIASLKEDITSQRSNLERLAGYLSTFGEQLITLKARKRSTAAVKLNIDHYRQEYIRMSNNLEKLRKELELYEPTKSTNTQSLISREEIATRVAIEPAVTSGCLSSH